MSTKRREYEYGRIVSVDIVPLGDNLAADVSAGATSITVEDACDFDEDGGLLLLAGAVYAYTTWTEDDSTGVGTLTGLNPVLAANAFEGDEVAVYDPMYACAATDKVCQVELVGDDGNVDTPEAALALHLVDKLDEGVRGVNGEQVKLELEGDEWVIVDIFGLGGPSASGTLFKRDLFTLSAGGAQTLELTYQPLPDSLHLYWHPAGGGGLFKDDAEWTLTGQELAVPDTDAFASGDVLVAKYAYTKGVRNLLTVPMGAVWKYATGLGSSTTYAQPTFNDSAWAEGPTPFGRGTGWAAITPNTGPLGALSNVWLRMKVSAGGGALTFTPYVDDELWIYLDGALVAHKTIADQTPVTVACARGPRTIAVYGLDTATPDMVVAVTVSEAP